MRILLVQESDWLEKGPHQQHHLIERLQLKGHEIRIIDFEIMWKNRPAEQIISKRSVHNVKGKVCKESRILVIRPAILKLPLLDYLSIPFTHGLEIYRQISEFKPSLIVGLGILNTYIAMRLAKKFRIPFVYYLIDALHTLIPVGGIRAFGKVVESRTLRASDLILVINRQLRDYVIGLGADSNKIIVLGAGVDTERLNPKTSGDAIRAKYGIEKDEVVLLFMGWLYTFSGIREVASSLIKHDGNPRLRLMVLGKGELYSELLDLRNNVIGDRLILINWQPYEKVPDFIAASDICLLPAHNNEVMRNIVPIKMYEYMACSKPVIATRLPGIVKEFGEDNGVIYVDHPDQVLSLVKELSTDRDKLSELGFRAASYVHRRSWQNLTNRFEEILNELVHERGGLYEKT